MRLTNYVERFQAKAPSKAHGQTKILLALAAAGAVGLMGRKVQADSGTWNGTTDGNWLSATNWSVNPAPGATSGLTNGDTATLSNAGNGNTTIVVDSGRNIGSITFSTASAAAYTIGGGPLLLSSGGTIQVASTVANHETFNAPIILEPGTNTTAGSYTFTTNAIANKALFFAGKITGGTTTGAGANGVVTLTLSGTNAGTGGATTSTISGNISDGGASGGVALIKSGTGIWSLTGTNSFTGAVTINGGRLTLNSAGALNAANVVYLNTGGTLFCLSNGTIAGLNDDGTGTGGTVTNPAASARAIILAGTGTYSFRGTIVNGGTSGMALTMNGTGTQTLTNAGNTFTGTTTINLGTLKSTATSGTPLGTGAMALNAGTLTLSPSGSGAGVALAGANTVAATKFTYGAGAQLVLDKGANTSLTYTVGNVGATANTVLARTANVGSTLIIAPANGTATTNFGAASGGERFIVNQGVTVSNNTVGGSIVGQNNDAAKTGDFLTYDATNGLKSTAANYTSRGGTSFGATVGEISDVSSNATIAAGTNPVALRVSGTSTTLTNSGATTVGTATNLVSGIILNGGTISGGTITTPTNGEFAIYASADGGTISSALNTATGQKGLSVFGPGALSFTSASNGYSGGTFINNSTLIVTNNNQLGLSTSAVVLNGGTLQANGITLGGGSRAFTLNGSGTVKVTSGTTTLQNASASSKFIGGTGSLVKSGDGELVLSGNTANTYSGGTNVTAGRLTTTGSATLGTGNVSVSNSGTVLELDHANSISDSASLILGNGTSLFLNFSNASTELVTSATINGVLFNTPTVFSFGNLHGVDSSYFQFQVGTNEGSLTIVSEPTSFVPEPTSLSLVTIGAAGLLRRRRQHVA